MANKYDTHYIRGTIYYAKVIGDPIYNEYSGQKEWSVDLTPNDEGRALLKKLGLSDRLRDPLKKSDGSPKTDKAGRTETYLSFRHRELKADGEKADPITIVDANNQSWDTRKIGNGSIGDVKFVVTPGKAGNKGMYIRALRVLEHVPFEPEEFAPLSSDDEYFANVAKEDQAFKETFLGEPEQTNEDDLDDDVPM